jgi:hypothetical protein
MRIIGFNLTKIAIERKEEIQGQLNINQNIDIKDVKKEKVPISEDEAIKINFNLQIDYSEDSAKVNFEGHVVLLPTKEELTKFLDSWKNKQIPEDSKIPLFNFIMNKCNIKALTLEDDLNLPTHIPLPKLNPKQEQK